MTVNRSSNSFYEINVGSEGMKYTEVKQGPEVTEEITDGGFSNQQTDPYPDNWAIYDVASDGGAVSGSWDQSTDSNTGTYALEQICNQSDGGGGFLSAAVTGSYGTAVASKTIQARFYAKQNVAVGTPVVAVGAFYYDDGTGTDYVWNLTSSAWVELGGGGDDGNNYEDISLTGGSTYTQYTSTQRTLPADADEFWINVVGYSDTTADSVIVDDLEWLLAGADVATNGGFENWTDYANQTTPLDDWNFEPGSNWDFASDEPGDSDYINFGTDGGDNVVEMYVKGSGMGNAERGYIYQTIAGDAAEEIDCTEIISTKTSDSQTGYLIALDANPGSHTEVWDFVTEQWDTLGTTVTDLPGTDNAKTLSGTTSYVSNDAGTITIPTSGNLVLVFMSDDGNSPTGQYEYYFKTASATSTAGAGTQIQQFNVKCDSYIDDFEDNDRILEWSFKGEGGPVPVALAITLSDEGEDELDVMWNSDLPGRQNFSEFDMVVAEPTADVNPATKGYVDESTVQYFGGTIDIDATTTGQTSIGTVPSGYSFLAVSYVLEYISSDAPNSDGILSIGTAGGSYNDVCNPVISAPTTSYSGGVAATNKISQGGEIFANVSVADTGTALTVRMHLTGILIPN